MEQLANSLSKHVVGEVYFDEYHRALYSTDASMYRMQPLGVVVPKVPEDVVVAVSLAAEHGVPLVPRGGGTSLSGQTVGTGLVIDFSKHLNQILDLDPQACTARVQPGVVLDQLNRAAAGEGLEFGPDVATSNRANLGGMIGNNSAGARSIMAGKTVDHVISLDVLLADGTPASLAPLDSAQLAEASQLPGRLGHVYREVQRVVAESKEEIIARFPTVLRRVSGYNLDEFVPACRERIDIPPGVQLVREREAKRFPGAQFNLAKLIVGAEGTLATVTEALVHLLPRPKQRGILVLEFDSLTHSINALATVREFQPSAVEMLDKMIVELAAESLEYRNYLDFVVGRPESLIVAEFSGESRAEVEDRITKLEERLQGTPGMFHTLRALDPALSNHIWACRKAALPLLMGIPGARKPIAFVEDTAVDPGRLPEFVARFREILDRAGTHGAFYGHASVGCMHIRPLIDTKNRDDLARMERIMDEVSDLVGEFGGSMSGEHGDGLARSFLNEKLFGTRLYAAFKQIKAAFDPNGLMNPGKVVDGPRPTENLRLSPDYKTMDVPTVFDFSSQGGFAAAAELCNGSAVCRKTQTGTMCPSFMATGDEEHSTRGRANALRLVLSGAVPTSEFTGRRLYETFDLCLQCKGCKAECPSNVDVAKLKSEFLFHYYKEHGVPLRVRAMANVARLNRLGSALAPLSNWAGKLPGAGWIAERIAGVDRRRPLPAFHRQHFRKWFRQRSNVPRGARGPIVLLDDCLTSYCEPGVNRAAVELLEAAGYEVHLAGIECCGRPPISKGLLDDARKLAASNIDALKGWAEQGVPIVGCEPSCLLTLTDDYLDLLDGEAVGKVAQSAALIETYLVREGIEFPLTPGHDKILLHGHCHQKALVGTGDTVRLLEQIPGTRVEVVDSGCCGMAGSFGYEHYDLSMKIGQRVLFPAVRASGDAKIAAPGFSCRHQIQHGTNRTALHPVQLLAQCLRTEAAAKREFVNVT